MSTGLPNLGNASSRLPFPDESTRVKSTIKTNHHKYTTPKVIPSDSNVDASSSVIRKAS